MYLLNLMTALLLFLISLTPLSAEDKPNVPEYFNYSVQYRFVGFAIEAGTCTATTIGPHALLTASHCERPSSTITIGANGQLAQVTSIVRDGFDHSILLLKDITFKHYARDIKPGAFNIMDEVYIVGNPSGFSSVFRKLTYVGVQPPNSPNTKLPPMQLFDGNTFFGDSGSGMFNSKGELVGVLSDIAWSSQDSADGEAKLIFRLTGIWPLQFKSADYEMARNYVWNPPSETNLNPFGPPISH